MRRTGQDRFVLRSKDAAHLLNMSPDDVIRLALDGKITAQKRGKFWRFTWAAVRHWKKREQLAAKK